MRGITSGVAPKSRNKGSRTNQPRTHALTEISNVRLMASVARRRAVSASPSPRARAIAEEVPAPRPMLRLVRIMTTGKVKLSAASGARPKCAMNKVSTTFSDIVAINPQTIGIAITFNWCETRPSIKVACSKCVIGEEQPLIVTAKNSGRVYTTRMYDPRTDNDAIRTAERSERYHAQLFVIIHRTFSNSKLPGTPSYHE